MALQPQAPAAPAPATEDPRLAQLRSQLAEANATIGRLTGEQEASRARAERVKGEVASLHQDIRKAQEMIATLRHDAQRSVSGKVQSGQVDLVKMANELCKYLRLDKDAFEAIQRTPQRDTAYRRLEDVIRALTSIVELIVKCKALAEKK